MERDVIHRGERRKAKLTFLSRVCSLSLFLPLLFYCNGAYKHYDNTCIRNIIRDAKSSCNEMKRAEEKIRYAETSRCA